MGSAPLKHARVDIGPVAVDDLQLPGELEASPDPLNKVVAVWANEGKVSAPHQRVALVAGEIEPPRVPHVAQQGFKRVIGLPIHYSPLFADGVPRN